MRHVALLAAVLLGPGQALAAAAADDACLTLSASRLGDAVHVFIGHRPRAAGAPRPWLSPGAACGGCGVGDPVIESYLARNGQGTWSGPRSVGVPLSGLTLENRGQVFTLKLGREVDGDVVGYHLSPLRTEEGRIQHRLDRTPEATAHAACALDSWTACFVEHVAGRILYLRRASSEGWDVHAFDEEDSVTWTPPWPAGTTLMGVDGLVEQQLVFGRDGATGRVHVEAVEGGATVSLPPLELGAEALAAGVWHAGAPAVFAFDRTGLVLWTLRDGTWSVSAPAPEVPEPAPGAALVAVSSGDRREEAVAVLADGSTAIIRSQAAGAWVSPVRLRLSEPAGPVRHASRLPARAADDAPPRGLPAWTWVAALAVACAVGLAALGIRALRASA
jgi:hypothetical protein